MSASDDESLRTALTASSLIDREGGLIPFIRNVGFGGISFAIILQIIDAIQGAGTVVIGIPRAIGLGMIYLIEVFFRTSGSVLGAGAERTIRSFATGLASLLGPLGQPAAVGIVMISIGLLIWGLNRVSISPLTAIQNLRR